METLIVEWRRMSLGGKVGRLVSWLVWGVMAVMAIRDLGKRGPGRIRGKKWLWMVLMMMPIISVKGFAVPVLEVVYFLVGRKR
jgi:hypothetical protein